MEAVINRKTGKKGKLLTRKLRGPKVGVYPDVSLLECKQGSGSSKAPPSKPLTLSPHNHNHTRQVPESVSRQAVSSFNEESLNPLAIPPQHAGEASAAISSLTEGSLTLAIPINVTEMEDTASYPLAVARTVVNIPEEGDEDNGTENKQTFSKCETTPFQQIMYAVWTLIALVFIR